MTLTTTPTPELQLLDVDDAPAAAILPKKWRNPDAGRRIRRGLPIHGYFGANGNGKSQIVVHDTLPDLDAGDPVLSTMRLINADTGDDYPNYIPWTDWDQVLDLRKGAVIADEIVGVAGSRNSMSLPIEVQNLLNQLRRGDMRFSWTAPAWARADLIIRETSQGATLCRASQFFGVHRISDDTGRERTWRQHTVFRFKTYDAQKFEAWTAAKESGNRKLRPVVSAGFKSTGTRAQASYDTFAPVNRVGLELDTGRCASCGGMRRPKPCSCSREDHRPRPTGRRSITFSGAPT